MECPNCGSYMKYLKKSKNQSSWYCPKCKIYPLENETSSVIDIEIKDYFPEQKPENSLCPKCGKENIPNANFCRYCGSQIKSELAPKEDTSLKQQELQAKIQLANLKVQQEQLALQQQQLQMQQLQYNSMLKCPKCGSTSITGQKKGYGVVKGSLGAVALFAVTGGVGAAVGLGAGNIGRKKIQCTCMNCGYRFKAGKK